MIDWQSLLYSPVYATLGVPATLTLPGTDGVELNVTALDKTAPVTLGQRMDRSSFAVEVDTVEPAAMVRATELVGIDLADLRDSRLTMNGKNWTVRSHLMVPAPTGEANGEVRLILSEEN